MVIFKIGLKNHHQTLHPHNFLMKCYIYDFYRHENLKNVSKLMFSEVLVIKNGFRTKFYIGYNLGQLQRPWFLLYFLTVFGR